MNEPEDRPETPPAPEPASAPTPEPRAATPTSESPAAETGAAPVTEGAAPAGSPPGDTEHGRPRRRRKRRRGKGPRAPGDAAQPQGPRPPQHHGGHRGHGHRHGHRGRDDDHGGEHHALHAVRSLSKLAESLLRVEGVDPLGMPRSINLQLRVPLDDERALRGAAGAAVEQILARVREVREHEQALRPGCVYSYFHQSADADGCRPTEPRQVFDGYHTTGRPVFSDFVTMAIERKDPNIERLLAGEDVILTHVTLGRVLRTQQLAEFGQQSPVYKILGQVDAGLFRVLSSEGRCAFSFQLLRGTTLEGRPRLRLHAVGKADLMDLADPSVLHTLSRFQRVLDEEALRLAGKQSNGEVDEEQFVLPLLQDLAQKLEGRHRRQSRRTHHAVERSEQGQRPTPRAYPDAGEAADDQILWDNEKSTVLVLGPKGRVHVFTPQARHVTSVVMPGAAIQNRRQQGRWRPAEPEERGEFRIALKRLVASGEAVPADENVPQATPDA